MKKAGIENVKQRKQKINKAILNGYSDNVWTHLLAAEVKSNYFIT